MARQPRGTHIQTPLGRMAYQTLDWTHNDARNAYIYGRTGFNFIAPTPKYAPAHNNLQEKTLIPHEAYDIGNQPFNWRVGTHVGGTNPKQFNAQYSQAVNPPQYSSAGVFNSNTSTASILAGLAARAQAMNGGQ